MGYARDEMPPAQFAKEKIDPRFGTDLFSFMQVYLKTKYSNEPLTRAEQNIVKEFYKPFHQKVRTQIPFKERFSKFLNFLQYNTFLFKTKNIIDGNSEYGNGITKYTAAY